MEARQKVAEIYYISATGTFGKKKKVSFWTQKSFFLGLKKGIKLHTEFSLVMIVI